MSVALAKSPRVKEQKQLATDPPPKKHSQLPKKKHPISLIAFAPKRNRNQLFASLKGVCGIYCIYSNSFATYIGQSNDVGKRLRKHVSDLRAGKYHNIALQHDWNFLGAQKFTYYLIERCEEKNQIS